MKLFLLFFFVLMTTYAESLTCRMKNIKIGKVKCTLTLMVDDQTNVVNLTSSSTKCTKKPFIIGSFASQNKLCKSYVCKLNILFNGNTSMINDAEALMQESACYPEWDTYMILPEVFE